jgi:hypothetical protein
MEDEQYERGTPFSSAQLLRQTGLRHHQTETARNGTVRILRYINKHGQQFHTIWVTYLYRHKNTLSPVITTAMAAAKFVVSISRTYMHTWLFSSVLLCVISTKEFLCSGIMTIPTALVKYIFLSWKSAIKLMAHLKISNRRKTAIIHKNTTVWAGSHLSPSNVQT